MVYKVDVCVCDSAPSVNTNTESFYILYSIYLLLSFTDCPHQTRERKKKKDLMRWKITNNRCCSHAQVKNPEKKRRKKTNKQTKEEEKLNSV